MSAAGPGPSPLLRLQGVSKAFPGVMALRGVDFTLRAGEIHAVMGQNGAGKSTLVNVIAAALRPDAGAMWLEDRAYRPASPAEAQEAGVGVVHQELHLLPDLRVADNLLLGREPLGRLGLIDRAAVMRDAAEALRSVGLSIDVRRTLGSLPLAVQQLVAIARATARAPRVLILDEPTSRLGEVETRRLFELLRRLRQRGMGLIFITHFLDQAYQLADRVTVLRNGARVGAWRLDELPRSALVGHMLGAALAGVQGTAAGAAAAHGVPVLEARGLQRRGSLGPTDLRLFEGETVGVVGLLGSGRTRLARLLFGLDRASGGTLWRRGRRVRLRHPRQAMRLGLGMLPENRRTQGVLPHLSLRENVALALQVRRGWLRPLSRRRQRELAHRFIQVLGIDTRDAETPVRLLSGGNQQKALLARWLAIDPAVLILDEPTRGIDVGAQSQVQRIIGELRRRGMAILLIDSALEELVRGSDRVVVMRDRRAVAELSGAGLNEESLMHAIAEGAAAAGSGPAAPTRR